MKVHDLTEKTTVAQTDEVYLAQSPYGSGDDRRASVANLGNAVGRYQDRGDPSASDWNQAGLTLDGHWHDLDCSAIVPAGAKSIEFFVEMATGEGGEGRFMIRKKGNSYNYNVDVIYTPHASTTVFGRLRVPCSTARFVQYEAGVDIETISITVVGWSF